METRHCAFYKYDECLVCNGRFCVSSLKESACRNKKFPSLDASNSKGEQGIATISPEERLEKCCINQLEFILIFIDELLPSFQGRHTGITIEFTGSSLCSGTKSFNLIKAILLDLSSEYFSWTIVFSTLILILSGEHSWEDTNLLQSGFLARLWSPSTIFLKLKISSNACVNALFNLYKLLH